MLQKRFIGAVRKDAAGTLPLPLTMMWESWSMRRSGPRSAISEDQIEGRVEVQVLDRPNTKLEIGILRGTESAIALLLVVRL